MGKDGNNNIYPITFVVVEAERGNTWCWFLDILMRDIGQCQHSFILDRQKVSSQFFMLQFS